jgi:hypothetical protein
MAMELELTDFHDPVLNMPIYQMMESVVVFGLPRLIGNARDYMLDALVDGLWNDDRDREAGEGFFIECPHRLEYL